MNGKPCCMKCDHSLINYAKRFDLRVCVCMNRDNKVRYNQEQKSVDLCSQYKEV